MNQQSISRTAHPPLKIHIIVLYVYIHKVDFIDRHVLNQKSESVFIKLFIQLQITNVTKLNI